MQNESRVTSRVPGNAPFKRQRIPILFRYVNCELFIRNNEIQPLSLPRQSIESLLRVCVFATLLWMTAWSFLHVWNASPNDVLKSYGFNAGRRLS